MKNSDIFTFLKVLALSIVTFGLYGAYWIMNSLYKASDISADETEKDVEYAQRAVASAFLSRHGFH